MADADGLYEIDTDIGEVPTGLPLVAGLTGFSDAGSGSRRSASTC
ncbi:hypothetical protein CMsap09_08885 [Clavibacter michiganensis]|uniref:Uncharacterized protein n=1 Tax=Clavibacter michiganensis TaxID=28447 RepID=A0A251XU72_9MICO|nr:hypothetical protein CMsap09_08885 [Clavibacter michiganensis]